MLEATAAPTRTNIEVWGTGAEYALRVRTYDIFISYVCEFFGPCHHGGGFLFWVYRSPVSSVALRRSTCGATDIRTHMHVCSDKNSPTYPLQHEKTHMQSYRSESKRSHPQQSDKQWTTIMTFTENEAQRQTCVADAPSNMK